MSEDRRDQRPARDGARGVARSDGRTGSKPTGRGATNARAAGKSDPPRTSKPDSRTSGKPAPRSDSKPAGRGAGTGQSGSRGRTSDWKRTDPSVPRTEEQAIYDGPDLPDEVSGQELDKAIAAQLKGLPEKLASRVARHLVAAGLLIDADPELAYRHALAARARVPRLAVVREAVGEAAYAAGHYAEALADLRAAKRMNGATAYLPIMADCHRALKQPEQAIKLAKSPSVANFPSEAKAEMTIVEAGARRDMGQLDSALRILELAPLQSKTRASWVVRLRYAYADTLEAAGREQDALAWFHRTHAVDADQLTDAEDRAAQLEKRQPPD